MASREKREQAQAESSNESGTQGTDAGASLPVDVGPADSATIEPSAATATAGGDEELAAARDKYLRLAAEFDNYRRRSMKERQEAGTRAQADLARNLLDALDDLARFAHLDPATADTATVVQGAEMVERKLMKALSAAGLEVVNPLNSTFDPALHEAVATEPAQSREDDHVVAKVYQPGYVFGGQLLRPARVVVRQWNG